MSYQVKPTTNDTKTEDTLSFFTRSFRSPLPMLLTACVAYGVWPISSASAQSTSGGDDWSIGTSADGNMPTSAAATVSVPAPATDSLTVQNSTAESPTPIAPNTGAATPGMATPTPANATEYEDTDPGALDAFRADLDPYGRWVDDSRYGHVWVPDTQLVGSDFAPYVSNGNWALDADNNWVWQSNYPFGGVVFHYGRWVWIDSVGWSWVPGRRYAPAWVVWRVPTDDYAYVGWAPAPPTFVWYGTGLFWLTYYPPMPFVFCPSHYVFYSNFGPYLVHDHRFAATLVNHSAWYSTAPIHGRGYVSPPLARARVPAYSVPTQRVSANPRAAALARPSANPRIGGATGGAGGATVHDTNRPMWDAHPARTGVPRDVARPVTASRSIAGNNMDSSTTRPASYAFRGVRTLGSMPSPQYAPQSNAYSPRYSAPYGGVSPRTSSLGYSSSPSRGYSAPNRGYAAPSNGYSAPNRGYVAPSNGYSAPIRSYSTPGSGYSAPRYSAPSAPSYSAPHSSFGSSYSAPSRSYSAPSFSAPRSSGGGFHGGGGGGHSGGGRHR
jgi:hypothetical protein